MGQNETLYAWKHPIPPFHSTLCTVVAITLGGRGGGSPNARAHRVHPPARPVMFIPPPGLIMEYVP